MLARHVVDRQLQKRPVVDMLSRRLDALIYSESRPALNIMEYTDSGASFRIGGGGDFTSQYDQTGIAERLGSDTGTRILLENRVENRVGNLIGHFIRMAL